MKDDMAGGAAVIGAMTAIARLKAPIAVVGVVPIAENMPSGRALRPGDVLKSASGKTVEVLNTDAEGRLILGDALWYARQQMGATHLVDIATLTASVVRALGKITSGLYGAPTAWVEHVRAVADRAGDRCWPMPLFEEYREQLKSEIADMVKSDASTLLAAQRPIGENSVLYLRPFVFSRAPTAQSRRRSPQSSLTQSTEKCVSRFFVPSCPSCLFVSSWCVFRRVSLCSPCSLW